MGRHPTNGAGRSDEERLPLSFAASGAIHGGLLLWLAVAAAYTPRGRPQSLYDMEIKPYEGHIVWYNLREKLPDIKPEPAPAARKAAPPRATRKFQQTLASAKKEDERAPQMIVTDAPPVELPKPLPLPNVVAEAAPAPPAPRVFLPPDAAADEAPAPVLPDAPAADARRDAAANPLEAHARPPEPLPFTPPEKKPDTAASPAALPEPPKVNAVASQTAAAPLAANQSKPQPLPFQAPPQPGRTRPAPLTVPESPAVAAANLTAAASPLGNTTPRPQPKTFQGPPPITPRGGGAAALTLPEAPASKPPASAEAPSLPRIPRGFTPPAGKKAAAPARPSIAEQAPPPLTDPASRGTESFAIAGLEPSKSAEVPERPPSHDAGFSGGPEVRPGPEAAASNERAALVVPSLTAGGGEPDPMPTIAPAAVPPSTRSRLLAELRTPLDKNVPGLLNAATSKATRVSSSPDPRMSGRVVYTMAIQMPNMTSYSGSWMVWYAEHVPEAGSATAEIRPPVPLHVVHPAYIRSAIDDKIEGTVRLAGVIGKDGHMSDIEVLAGIDQRLDDSSQEALAKWTFEPAQRNGSPIAVDAVFEVPFRLAPKPARQ